MAEKKILVTQARSTIRRHRRQLATLECLGLGRVGRSAVHRKDATTLGMINKVAHLVHVREVEK